MLRKVFSVSAVSLLTLVTASWPVVVAEAVGLNIQIVAGPDKNSSSVKVTGSIIQVVSNDDRKSFKIGDANLKKAVGTYFGKAPNEAYVKSPTPWGGLYKRYNWQPVQRVLHAIDARVLDITYEPVILSTKELVNNSNKTATFDASISEDVTNTVQSNWSNAESIKVGQKVSYEAKVEGTGVGGETSIEYTSTWGQGGSKSMSTSVGSKQGVQVTLDPGESVSAQLTASRGTMKVRIVYEAYLIGTTAINYNPKHKGHHFWDLSIAGVMQAGGLKNSIQVVEDVEVGYYSNGKVILNPATGG